LTESPQPRYRDYDDFADIYNKRWGGFAVRVMEPLRRLVFDELSPGDHIVDLCCGTGQLAAQLVDAGFRVTGVDGSERMIAHAGRNATGADFIVADARSYVLAEKAAGVVSTFDSLNHVMTIEGLTAVFERTAAVLEPGGKFVFDLNMEDGYRERWRGTFNLVEDDEVLVASSSYDPALRVGEMKFTVFRDVGGDGPEWRRTDVTLTQRCYSEPEVIAALHRADFTDVAVHDAATMGEEWESGRSFFVATRAG
jgi:SAM-dependent methyltransferase